MLSLLLALAVVGQAPAISSAYDKAEDQLNFKVSGRIANGMVLAISSLSTGRTRPPVDGGEKVWMMIRSVSRRVLYKENHHLVIMVDGKKIYEEEDEVVYKVSKDGESSVERLLVYVPAELVGQMSRGRKAEVHVGSKEVALSAAMMSTLVNYSDRLSAGEEKEQK
jgi:hypothetical protein